MIEKEFQRGTYHARSLLMYSDLLCREGSFDDAEAAFSRVEDAISPESRQAILEDMFLRRRIWDRKQVRTSTTT